MRPTVQLVSAVDQQGNEATRCNEKYWLRTLAAGCRRKEREPWSSGAVWVLGSPIAILKNEGHELKIYVIVGFLPLKPVGLSGQPHQASGPDGWFNIGALAQPPVWHRGFWYRTPTPAECVATSIGDQPASLKDTAGMWFWWEFGMPGASTSPESRCPRPSSLGEAALSLSAPSAAQSAQRDASTNFRGVSPRRSCRLHFRVACMCTDG